jgi:ABC-type Na+ efflux pump permease subunit
MNAIKQLVRLEYLLTLRNRQVLPLLILFPLIGMALPSLLVLSASKLLAQAQTSGDALVGSVLGMVRALALVSDLDLTEAARVLLMRSSAAFYVLMPSIMLPITASFAVVGERQRRTLEPLLATPISDREFCLGKLVAVILPAILTTWAAATIGAVLAALLVHADHGVWMWPDLIWLLGVLLLTPLLAVLVALCCLWVSIRAKDPQSATQVSALVMMPLLLLVLTLVGPLMLMSAPAIGLAALVLCAADVLLLLKVLRVFGRSGLLGSV